MPLTPTQRHLCTSGWLALVVWMVAAFFGPALLAYVGVNLSPNGHGHLFAHGHPFVDARAWAGIPNALDVLSNAPLALVGGWGLAVLKRAGAAAFHINTYQALRVFSWGLVFTAVGSSVYHWAPDAQGLVFDRLGMAVIFAGALGLAMAERVGALIARNTLLAMLLVGCLSAVMPLVHGNVLPWVVVQFGGMAFMAWAALRKPLPTALGVSLGGLLALYALAKAFEMGDAGVFHATGGLVSGHSLKHLVAALAAWPVMRAMRQNAQARGSEARQ
ncbi:hypothetical protein LPB72_20745 [Hydrogenophaga crassostreae]|uniref:Alkaline phytoceramidase n=1 Tax=Hydrogenophaga crassostreae TaxID=1763535 RepID=A0A167GNB9_9BURK|nr:hypothetical protein [Hydrogenophaga crassostreae]AOW14859.1 hypothetical protein LPB072_20575 [Hydrogenophaga crassostreae]OAD39687.1 hypothetical protein LPB72_20745 [Hydrogenophaga crassostreae]